MSDDLYENKGYKALERTTEHRNISRKSSTFEKKQYKEKESIKQPLYSRQLKRRGITSERNTVKLETYSTQAVENDVSAKSNFDLL